MLQIKNEGLNNQLKNGVPMLQSIMVEQFKKETLLESTMETFCFHNLADEFKDKVYLVDDLEEEVNPLSNIESVSLKEENCRLEETNSQLTNEVSHLQSSIDEIHEEVAPLQEGSNLLFDEYQSKIMILCC